MGKKRPPVQSSEGPKAPQKGAKADHTPSKEKTSTPEKAGHVSAAPTSLFGAVIAAAISIVVAFTFTTGCHNLIVARNAYSADRFPTEYDSYNQITKHCGNYYQASIRGRGFSHVTIPNFLFPVDIAANASGHPLKAYNPSITLLPHGDYLVLFHLSNTHHCDSNRNSMQEQVFGRIGAMVLDAKLRVRNAAHVVEGFEYEAYKCHLDAPEGILREGLEDPRVFVFQREPWALVTKVAHPDSKGGSVPRCEAQLALCPLMVLPGAPVACQNNRILHLRHPKIAGRGVLPGAHRDWSPFEFSGQLYLSSTIEPHVVLRLNVITGAVTKVAETQTRIFQSVMCKDRAGQPVVTPFLGGSPTISMQWNGQTRHVALARHTGLPEGQTFMFFYMFQPRQVKTGIDFPITEVSQAFCIADDDGHCERLQFPAGLTMSPAEDQMLVAYGANDCEARLAILQMRDFTGLFLNY